MAEANVKSLEAIETFIESVAKLRHDTGKQTDDIRQQLQRVSAWLEKELPDYWSNEKRIAEKKWIEARQDLLRCEATTRAEDDSPCSIQRKALCEERSRSIPRYALEWNRFVQEFSTNVRQLDDLSESSLLNAWNRLQSILESLKKYANL